jgi:hypothetical protein
MSGAQDCFYAILGISEMAEEQEGRDQYPITILFPLDLQIFN